MTASPKYHYFPEAITLWLAEKGYVTLQATEEDRSFMTKLLGNLKHLYVSLSTPAQIVKTTADFMTYGFTSGTGMEVIKMIKNVAQHHNKLTMSLRPVISGSMQHFRQLSDLAAYRLDWRYNLLVITVTFADDLDPELIWDRCGRMVKVPFRLTTMKPHPGNIVLIYALFIYFDAQKFAQHAPILAAKGRRHSVSYGGYLMGGVIGVPTAQIIWSQPSGGVSGIWDKYMWWGYAQPPLDTEALITIRGLQVALTQ